MLDGVLGRLTRCEVLYHSSPERMSTYQLLQARAQFRTAGPPAGVVVSVAHSTGMECIYSELPLIWTPEMRPPLY